MNCSVLAPGVSSTIAPALDPPRGLSCGRSLAEYCRGFALPPATLRRRPVLDVDAGPSSFTAEACRLGIDAVAVDPSYGLPVAELTARLEQGPGAAVRHFLEDYAVHGAAGRYFQAALPHLPFFDGAFDLVLCAHLPFREECARDDGFHVAACRELVRVSRDEVRIQSWERPDGGRDRALVRLRADLAQAGIAAQVVTVPPEAGRRAPPLLVLTRAAR